MWRCGDLNLQFQGRMYKLLPSYARVSKIFRSIRQKIKCLNLYFTFINFKKFIFFKMIHFLSL